MEPLHIGFALCGSFCTFSQAIPQLEALAAAGHDVYPIMSFNAYSLDTRFGKAADHVSRIEAACGRKIIAALPDAEPIGPKKLLDILIIEPCTGNTLAKLAAGVADTPVTLAAKSNSAVPSAGSTRTVSAAGLPLAGLFAFWGWIVSRSSQPKPITSAATATAATASASHFFILPFPMFTPPDQASCPGSTSFSLAGNCASYRSNSSGCCSA